jgi:ATP-binding cassette subfamily B multidrug efflux pump
MSSAPENSPKNGSEKRPERRPEKQPESHEDRVRIGTTLYEMMRHLWPYFMRQKLLFWLTLVCVFTVAAAGRLTITVFGWAIDNGILKKDPQVVAWAAVAFAVLAIGRCYMTFLQAYLFAKIGNRALYEIREELVAHVQHLPLTYFDRNPSGRIVTRITNDVVSLGELFTEGLINIFAGAIALVAIVIAMLAISVKMTLWTLLVAPVLLWVVKVLSARILIVLRGSKAKIAALNAFVAESISGMRVLQLFGKAETFNGKFAALSVDYREQQLESVQLYALLWPAVNFFSAASVAIALYTGGVMIFRDAITAGAMVAFILHVRAFMDPLHMILEKYQNLQNSLSGAERIFTLLEEAQEDRSGPVLANRRLNGAIEFQKMDFSYGPGLANALDQIDLTIEPGQSVALVGRTGSGKSTTISLLQRFYEPTAGHIIIDGMNLGQMARAEVRARIGVVQQDTFMFRGTIAQNISLGDPRLTTKMIEDAAERACLKEMLTRHSLGLDARVEERGANLSFGEKQLVAFARILAFDPDILILDEATANIDSHSEHLIQEATKRVRAGRTSIVIAHRISTILDCDKIVVLDKGKIMEVGTHRDLYDKGGIYRKLCDSQFNELSVEQTVKGQIETPAF